MDKISVQIVNNDVSLILKLTEVVQSKVINRAHLTYQT